MTVKKRFVVGVQVGRKKADYRIKVISKTGKSKAFAIFGTKLSLDQLVSKLAECLEKK